MELDYTKLFTDTTIIINGLKMELEAANIQYLVKDRFESARLGGYGEQQASVELYVLQKDIEKAEKVLSAYKSQINA
ncbi:putative signal transducing protein [Polaribacter sp. R77954]|uniref:putative signal transducing protein n=1 Tax=Polaribacter sp. R77954 TaxID=3093870 RepID=UPI0037C581F5